ncbi:MAG: OmpA family protein [Labilithrix sp.]|nr:OmpA family protein [Labilithrix sp.]
MAPAKLPDRDNDGIDDDADRCPDEPEDCDGFEDADGCPDEDNDGDGIPDYCDRCPDAPGTRSRHGCPHIILEYSLIQVPHVASFQINGDKPSFEADGLDQIVELAKNERLIRLGVVGHSLAIEKNAARLATRRAAAVKNVLVGRGVPPTKLDLRASPVGEGDPCPLSGDGGAPAPCVTFSLVETEGFRMVWDGARYVEPRPPEEPFVCPPEPPRPVGHPCEQRSPPSPLGSP